jgi:hypothetical protein
VGTALNKSFANASGDFATVIGALARQVRPLSQQPLEIRHAVLSPRRNRSRAASRNLHYCTLALFSTVRRSR